LLSFSKGGPFQVRQDSRFPSESNRSPIEFHVRSQGTEMKKEVSCRALLAYFHWARKKNITPETLCAGVAYPLSVLCDPHERVEWDVFCKITSNLRALLTEEEFETMGREAATSGPLSSWATVPGRLLFSCTEWYRWWNSDARGPGSQLFACVTPSMQQLSKNHITVTLLLAPDHQDCRELFILSKQGLAMIPTIIGLPPATVQMREIQRGAVYDIVYPEGGGALWWVRRALMWPFAARKVARELKAANELLHERYAQLEEAQMKIQHQARQLRTAFSVSQLIRSNLDLDATIEAVAQSLVEAAHFAAAKVAVFARSELAGLSRVVTKGDTLSSERVLTKTLEARGQTLGELSVRLRARADLHEAEELLDQIASSVAMEINDALSFTLLTEYRNRDKLIQQEFSRQQIESQEAERKRLAAELHDGLGQDLLIASNELQQFLRESKEPHEELRQVASLLQGSIEGVREIASNLHPHHLDRLGFSAAITAMTESLSRTTGLAIQSSCDDIDNLLPKETELHLYRVIQEALTNVVRHASARSARVRVRRNPESVNITVTDDGIGFEPRAALERLPTNGYPERFDGFGLSSMVERARIVGGKTNIESSPGYGTMVHVSVPLFLKTNAGEGGGTYDIGR
jgi:signal transduction histidine kinase